MPANRFNGFTDYGVGIGLRIPHYDHIFSEKPVVDWFEIISENYMIDALKATRYLVRSEAVESAGRNELHEEVFA